MRKDKIARLFYLHLIFILLLFFTSSCEKSIFGENRSDVEIVRFKINIQYKGVEYSDYGVLMLPCGYNQASDSTDLVIYCHSGGGTVKEDGSECESMDYCKYLVSRGYAILSMAAMPSSLAKKLQIDQFRTVGSAVSVECCVKGIEYITEQYKFSDNFYLLSNSNGGLIASSILHSAPSIKIKAQCGISPLLSIEKNAWFVRAGSMSGGKYDKYQNRANIISLFDMKPVSTLEELVSAEYEKSKVGEYDPYDFYMYETDIAYPCPYLIFSCVKDNAIYYHLASDFSEEINSRGGYIKIDTTTSYGAHNIPANPKIVGTFLYRGKEIEVNEVYVKIHDFFKQFNN